MAGQADRGGIGDDAWARLSRWLDPEMSDENPAYALRALGDVTVVRHLLDQAELRAVRVARAGKASWTEIGTQLGISRQAAWEKWRDLEADGVSSEELSERVWPEDSDPSVTTRRVPGMATRRRGGKVPVPDVVGLDLRAASAVLIELGLEAVPAGPAR